MPRDVEGVHKLERRVQRAVTHVIAGARKALATGLLIANGVALVRVGVLVIGAGLLLIAGRMQC